MSLPNKVAQFDADSDLVNAWVHGPASGTGSTVTTDSGPVRTPAKLIFDQNAAINEAAVGVLALSTAQAVISTTQAGIATTQAVLSGDEKVAAIAAKVAAELARDAALVNAGVYVDEPTGRAAVADGEAFRVQGTGDVATYEYRRVNASTVSTLIASYPSIAAYNAAKLASDNAKTSSDLSLIALVQTAASCVQTQEIVARFHAFN